MKKFILSIIIFMRLCMASQEQFLQALDLEQQGKFKEAMQIYKKIAREYVEQNLNTSNPINQNTNVAAMKNQSANYQINADEILGIKLYEPNYIAPASISTKSFDGRKRFETKFQISLQKPLIYDFFGLNESVIAAYSQTSWWQTAKSSTPFRESNYRPEIFLKIPTNFQILPQLKALNFGFLHESNGLGGEMSRSWNRLYAKGEFNVWRLIIEPRIWARIPDNKDDNPHINDYIGNADVNFITPLGDHFLRLMLRNNLHLDNTNKGAAEFSWLFPLSKSGVYGYLQYFSGYGESLIDYNHYTNKISLGVSILR